MDLWIAATKLRTRNNVHVGGAGPITLVFAHGFGCDQNMWRTFAQTFGKNYQTIMFDLVGSGRSDLSAYDRNKYGSIRGYAGDVLEIVDRFMTGPAVFVGHSVSATIGMLAAIQSPEKYAANLMIGPSPCFINDGEYVGGFERDDIEEMLETLENNYLGWAGSMAPAIMGAPERPELGEELANSFCRTDPDIAAHFARVTFLADYRRELSSVTTPTLIIQSNDDLLAPVAVGEYMHKTIVGSTLAVVDNVGHCPHLSAPEPSGAAIQASLRGLGL